MTIHHLIDDQDTPLKQEKTPMIYRFWESFENELLLLQGF